MFTGIIEGYVTVASLVRTSDAAVLSVELGELAEGCKIGDSVSIDGACLTVAKLNGGVASFDVVAETLACTTLGGLAAGRRVNVERALRAGDRLGGHLVAGHVDAVGHIQSKSRQGSGSVLSFTVPERLTEEMIEKGSVAVDGVSLTLVNIGASTFSVAVIPHTLEVTTLGAKSVGDGVNIETDMIGKWVKKLLFKGQSTPAGITEKMLAGHGFM